MKYPYVAIGVVAAHLSFLSSCKEVKDIILPKKSGTITTVEVQKRSDFTFIPMGASPISCPKRYIGIGLRFDWGEKLVVIKVAPGSPAEQAGILEGDILLKDEWYGSLEIGQEVELPIERNGNTIMYKMKVNYICYDE